MNNPDDPPKRSARQRRKPVSQLTENQRDNNFQKDMKLEDTIWLQVKGIHYCKMNNPDDPPKRSARQRRKPVSQLTENQPDNKMNNPDGPPKRSARERRKPVSQLTENQPDNDGTRAKRKILNKTKAETEGSSDIGEHEKLSAYELERLENIRQNKVFLSSINLLQATDDLKRSTRPKPSQKRNLTSRSNIAEKDKLPPRKSLRLQKMSPDGVTPKPATYDGTSAKRKRQNETNAETEDVESSHINPPGPLPMDPVNMEEGSGLPPELLQLCSEVSTNEEKVELDLKQYSSALKNMKIPEDGVAKVVMSRIFSAAFHPCTSSLLMAAGDKLGKVGLWNFGAGWGDDHGVLLFEPHTGPVSCMAFSRANPAHLLSLSYDGSIRCMDIEKAIFDDVYAIKDGLKTFDFLSDDCSTLVVGDWSGDVAIVDRRTPGNFYESFNQLDTKIIRCVNVHPLHKQYFVVAENKMVSIYDSRSLKKTNSEPVCQLHGHRLSISSAYFSSTGNRVLTSCLDNRIRIYDTSALLSKAPLVTSIGHNMHTGRWLSKLAAVWDPKQEDCFVVGSMDRPRRVQVYHESGQLLHSFRDEDHLTTVLSVTAFHPSRNALLGGNATGRLHVFTH